MKNKKKILKEVFKYLLFLALTVVLLYFSFKGVSFADLLDGLRAVNIGWIAASMVVGYAGFLIRARRWQFIIEPLGYKPSFKNTYDAVMMTYLSNFAVPRMGEVVRCGVLRKTEKIPFESLFGTVVLERIFDLVCLLLITFTVILLRLELFGNFIYTKLVKPLLDGLSGDTHLWLYLLLGVFAIAAVCFIFRKQIAQRLSTGKMKHLWKGLVDGLKSGFRLQRRGAFFSHTALLWFAYWLQAFTVMMAMPETQGLTWVDALFLMVVGGLGWVAPTQGGLGSYHAIIILALGLYGIDNGIVFATISHETQALMMIAFGLISWVSIALRSSGKAQTHEIN